MVRDLAPDDPQIKELSRRISLDQALDKVKPATEWFKTTVSKMRGR